MSARMHLEDFVGPFKYSGDQLCYKDCPVCGSSRWKTYVNPETGGWFCHAGEHGGGGVAEVPRSLEGATRYILDLLSGVRSSRMEWPEVTLPAWEERPSRYFWRYLSQRGIGEQDVARLGLLDASEPLLGRVLIPYRDRERRVVYWNTRAYAGCAQGPKYKGAPGRHPLYVLPQRQQVIEPLDRLVIVEGAFDAIRVWQAGIDVAAIGGKYLPRYLVPDLLDLVHRDTDLVVMLDRDALAQALKLRSLLSQYVNTVRCALPLRGDPADCAPEEVQRCL